MPHLVVTVKQQETIKLEYPGGEILLSSVPSDVADMPKRKLSIIAPKEVVVSRIKKVRLTEGSAE